MSIRIPARFWRIAGGLAVALAAAVAGGLHWVAPAAAASLVQVTNFGANPGGDQMYVYVPDSVTAHPAILVALHQCTGSGPGFYSSTEFASLADKYGFIVIYPSATRSGSCWDVSSSQALTRNGGSDPVSIMSMITYAEQHYNGDSSRVYVTGASSGAMMTDVLLGDYPDVFQAGAAFMGVPFGCFYTGTVDGWNSACAQGQVTMTPQAWGNEVRAADPGYSGPRPRVQLWHGTADPTLNYVNFGEEIKQWTNVLGVSQTPSSTDTPVSGWTRTRYDNSAGTAEVEAYSIAGAGHVLPRGRHGRLRHPLLRPGHHGAGQPAADHCPADHQPADHQPADHRAAHEPAADQPGPRHRLPRQLRHVEPVGRRLRRQRHHRQHRDRPGQRLDTAVHVPRRPEDHQRLGHGRQPERRGRDRHQRQLRREHQPRRQHLVRLPGHLGVQRRPACHLHPQRHHLHLTQGRLTGPGRGRAS